MDSFRTHKGLTVVVQSGWLHFCAVRSVKDACGFLVEIGRIAVLYVSVPMMPFVRALPRNSLGQMAFEPVILPGPLDPPSRMCNDGGSLGSCVELVRGPPRRPIDTS